MPSEEELLANRIRALPDAELARMIGVDRDKYRDEALEHADAEVARRGLDLGRLRVAEPAVSVRGDAGGAPALQPLDTQRLIGPRVGYAAGAILLTVEITLASLGLFESSSWPLVLSGLYMVGFVQYLAAVQRLHAVLGAASAGSYPVSPVRAVGLHFVPLYNLYWFYAWPRRISDFVARARGERSIGRHAFGAALLAAFLSQVLAGGVGLLALTFVFDRLQRRLVAALPVTGVAGLDTRDWSSRATVGGS
jgi:hypothetical protein